jgi:hypothetical protein
MPDNAAPATPPPADPWRAMTLAATFAVDDEHKNATYAYVGIGGAVVFAYVKDGVLHVSLQLEDVEPPLRGPGGDEGCVPIEIDVGGTVVFAVDATGRETPAWKE